MGSGVTPRPGYVLATLGHCRLAFLCDRISVVPCSSCLGGAMVPARPHGSCSRWFMLERQIINDIAAAGPWRDGTGADQTRVNVSPWAGGSILGRMVMKTGRLYLTAIIALGTLSTIPVLAAPVDAGTSPESRDKAARHAQAYNAQPREAFEACRGRPSGVQCTYVVTPMGTTYRRQVDGSCWAPENSRRLPLVCQ